MQYVVFGELLPESFRLCRSPAPVMAAVLGVSNQAWAWFWDKKETRPAKWRDGVCFKK